MVPGFALAGVRRSAGTGEGTDRGASDDISHDPDRRRLDLLPRGGSEGRARHPAAARRTDLLAAVRAALRAALRALSPRRARLAGLRAQRLAVPEAVRVLVRPRRRSDEQAHPDARSLEVHALHARLRRAG